MVGENVVEVVLTLVGFGGTGKLVPAWPPRLTATSPARSCTTTTTIIYSNFMVT